MSKNQFLIIPKEETNNNGKKRYVIDIGTHNINMDTTKGKTYVNQRSHHLWKQIMPNDYFNNKNISSEDNSYSIYKKNPTTKKIEEYVHYKDWEDYLIELGKKGLLNPENLTEIQKEELFEKNYNNMIAKKNQEYIMRIYGENNMNENYKTIFDDDFIMKKENNINLYKIRKDAYVNTVEQKLKEQSFFPNNILSYATIVTSQGLNQSGDKSIYQDGKTGIAPTMADMTLLSLALISKPVKQILDNHAVKLTKEVGSKDHYIIEEDQFNNAELTIIQQELDKYNKKSTYEFITISKNPIDTYGSEQISPITHLKNNIFETKGFQINNQLLKAYNVDYDGDNIILSKKINKYLYEYRPEHWNYKTTEIYANLRQNVNWLMTDENKNKIDIINDINDYHKLEYNKIMNEHYQNLKDLLFDYDKLYEQKINEKKSKEMQKSLNRRYFQIMLDFEKKASNIENDPSSYDLSKTDELNDNIGFIVKTMSKEMTKQLILYPNENTILDTKNNYISGDNVFIQHFLFPEFFQSVHEDRKTALLKFFNQAMVSNYIAKKLKELNLFSKEDINEILDTYTTKNVRFHQKGHLIDTEKEMIYHEGKKINLFDVNNFLKTNLPLITRNELNPIIFVEEQTNYSNLFRSVVRGALGTDNQTIVQWISGQYIRQMKSTGEFEKSVKKLMELKNISQIQATFEITHKFQLDSLKTKKQMPFLRNVPDLNYRNPLLKKSFVYANNEFVRNGLRLDSGFVTLPKEIGLEKKIKTVDFSGKNFLEQKAYILDTIRAIKNVALKNYSENNIILDVLEKIGASELAYSNLKTYVSSFPKIVNNVANFEPTIDISELNIDEYSMNEYRSGNIILDELFDIDSDFFKVIVDRTEIRDEDIEHHKKMYDFLKESKIKEKQKLEKNKQINLPINFIDQKKTQMVASKENIISYFDELEKATDILLTGAIFNEEIASKNPNENISLSKNTDAWNKSITYNEEIAKKIFPAKELKNITNVLARAIIPINLNEKDKLKKNSTNTYYDKNFEYLENISLAFHNVASFPIHLLDYEHTSILRPNLNWSTDKMTIFANPNTFDETGPTSTLIRKPYSKTKTRNIIEEKNYQIYFEPEKTKNTYFNVLTEKEETNPIFAKINYGPLPLPMANLFGKPNYGKFKASSYIIDPVFAQKPLHKYTVSNLNNLRTKIKRQDVENSIALELFSGRHSKNEYKNILDIKFISDIKKNVSLNEVINEKFYSKLVPIASGSLGGVDENETNSENKISARNPYLRALFLTEKMKEVINFDSTSDDGKFNKQKLRNKIIETVGILGKFDKTNNNVFVINSDLENEEGKTVYHKIAKEYNETKKIIDKRLEGKTGKERELEVNLLNRELDILNDEKINID